VMGVRGGCGCASDPGQIRAGLLEVLVDGGRGYESWRVSEAALAVATGPAVWPLVSGGG
jgi:hypothetical protein